MKLSDITKAIDEIESEYRKKNVDPFYCPEDYKFWYDKFVEEFDEEPTPGEVYEYKLESILNDRDWEETEESHKRNIQ